MSDRSIPHTPNEKTIKAIEEAKSLDEKQNWTEEFYKKALLRERVYIFFYGLWMKMETVFYLLHFDELGVWYRRKYNKHAKWCCSLFCEDAICCCQRNREYRDEEN